MRFRRKQKIESRRAKPGVGHSLSSNSYYRPTKRPIEDLHGIEKSKSSEKQSKKQDGSATRLIHIKPSTIINVSILIIFFVLVFFATTLSATPTILVPENSYVYHDETEYKASAAEILNESVLQRSKIFFRSSDFESSMLQKYPELSNVEAIVPLGGRDLSVALTVSQPLAVVQNGTEKGILDANGVLVLSGEQDAGDLYTIRFTSPQDSFSVGSRILTEDEIRLLQLLESESSGFLKNTDNQQGLTIKEVVFNVADGVFEVYFNEVEFYIRLSSYANTEEQVGAVKALLRKLQADQQPTKYIDVRVPGRVYVL